LVERESSPPEVEPELEAAPELGRSVPERSEAAIRFATEGMLMEALA
jgi:hypothetical protein